MADVEPQNVLVQALLPRTLTDPPLKLLLKLMVMVALSDELADTTNAPLGKVQL